ncbi:MAG: FG-GAP repeat protein [Myxococcota bacterium]|jgi:hypothetical protein|nr:FG-GAP repeat protein [Myxococcota bacterium]
MQRAPSHSTPIVLLTCLVLALALACGMSGSSSSDGSSGAECETPSCKLTALDGETQDRFGSALSAFDDLLVVGARAADTDVVGEDFPIGDTGAAYVYEFDGTNWVDEKVLVSASSGVDSNFGASVSASADTIVVGSPGRRRSGAGSGVAYVFTPNVGGTAWEQSAEIFYTRYNPGTSDAFGTSVGISGDFIVIGSPGEDASGRYSETGAAYVFERNGANWTRRANLLASDRTGGEALGGSVSISGDTIVAGATGDADGGAYSGAVYVFERNGTSWDEQQKLVAPDAAAGDNFGATAVVVDDVIVVGAPGASGFSGAVYVFERNGTSWDYRQKLVASDAANEDRFGGAVSLAGDSLVVGARGKDVDGGWSGAAYLFLDTPGGWVEQETLTAVDAAPGDLFGTTVAVTDDAIVVGATGDDTAGLESGSAYLFD